MERISPDRKAVPNPHTGETGGSLRPGAPSPARRAQQPFEILSRRDEQSFQVHRRQTPEAELAHPVPLFPLPEAAQRAPGSIQTLRLRIAF
jgi:hypothetical protein